MIMKMYKGTLKDIIFHHENIFTLAQQKQMALDIATGGKQIHSFGIIHFDIKPHNILFEISKGLITCVISDFGVSKGHI